MGVTFSLNNNHDSPDAASLTFPNGDFTALAIIRPGSDITSGQDIFSTGVWGAANTVNFYIASGFLATQINTGINQDITVVAEQWIAAMVRRQSGTLTIHSCQMGSSTVTSSGGQAIAAASDGSTWGWGHRPDAPANPFLGSMSDFIFIPGVALSTTDLSDIATGTAMDSTSWWASRELHFIAYDDTPVSRLDNTGNHTITRNGSPVFIADPVELVRFGVSAIDGIPGQISLQGVAGSVSQAMIIDGSIAQMSLSGIAGEVIQDMQINGTPGQISLQGVPGLAMNPDQRIIINGIPGQMSMSGVPGLASLSALINGGISGISMAGVKGSVIQILPPPGLKSIAGADIFIIADNDVENATITASSVASGFDVDNLKNYAKNSVLRSVGLSDQTITFTWGSSVELSGLGIAFSNLVSGSEVTLNLYTNAVDVTPAWTLGPLTVNYSYEPPYGFSTIGLASYAFGGGNYFSSLFSKTTAEKADVVLSSPSNPDGHIEVSNVVLGLALTPGRGASLGARISHSDGSTRRRKDNGDVSVHRNSKFKRISFSMNTISPDDKIALMRPYKSNGTSKPVFISAHQNDKNPEGVTSYTILGYFEEIPSFVNFSHDKFITDLSVEEI